MRFIVVGTSGAGKSTFACALADAAGCPYIELDRFYWGENWTAVPHEKFKSLTLAATAGDRWVVDGNYGAVRDALWARATHIVWLNFDRKTVFSRLLWRTISTGVMGKTLSHGNRESLRMAFFSRDSVLLWSLTTFASNRIKFSSLRKDPNFYHLQWIEVTKPSQARNLIQFYTPMKTKPQLRRSARLIILDPDGRLLLFRYQDEHKPAFWSTAGGELQAGEEYRDAAHRELHEETGFNSEVGPLLHEREDLYAVARSQPARWVEHYFLVECDRAGTPSRANWTDEERTTIQDWKWWSLAEMGEEPKSFLPTCLPQILERSLVLTGKHRRTA